MTNLFHVFPNQPPTVSISKADRHYLITGDGRKLLDVTAGGTHYAIVGYKNEAVTSAITSQLERFGHVDYKLWLNDDCEKLANLMLRHSAGRFTRVYFAGNSGAEANEAAMKMSYQVHYDSGYRDRKWFISRKQSYHGSTADALAIGERPNLEFYRPMLSPFRALIDEHNVYRQRRVGETVEEYEGRSVQSLREKIEELGPENVCAFIGETIMGGLVGDVPPTRSYWRSIRKVCDDYGIHLILDEVYCGTGITGSYFCCDYDDVTPDFLTLGKTIAAGFGSLSAVLTNDRIYEVIKSGQGRLQHTTTFQANSLAVSAAIAVQEIMSSDQTLLQVRRVGEWLKSQLEQALSGLPGFKNVRGRGLRLSVEYDFGHRSNEFGETLARSLLERHAIITSAKWNRISVTPSITVSESELDTFVSALASCYADLARDLARDLVRL